MAASAITAVPVKEKTPLPPVDREKTCPFLLRVFWSNGKPYHVNEFTRGNTPTNELQIYTWCAPTCFQLRETWRRLRLPCVGYTHRIFLNDTGPQKHYFNIREMDATLKELATLVKEVNPDARRKGTFIDFNIVFPHTQQGKYVTRDIGSICVGRRGVDDSTTLKEKRFIIGDYLNIAITPPAGGRGRGGGGARPY